MALGYVYGIDEEDCSIVHLRLGRDCCGSPERCDYKGSTVDIESLLNLYNIKHINHSGALSYDDVELVVNSGGIVMAFVKYDEERKHLVIINGYNEGRDSLFIVDPLFGASEVKYEPLMISGVAAEWVYSIVIVR